jgi:AraC-like DNA-binding protein
MHTIPVHRYAGNDFLCIKAILQPAALHQLLRFSVNELTNKYINAEDIWGNEIRSVCDCLKNLDNLPDMITAIERFIESRIKKIKNGLHPIDKAFDLLFYEENKISVKWLASQSFLCERQFIRKFEEKIGIRTTTLARIIRFDKAYRMKNLHPECDWLFIAVECNYHDYQHMVKDFQAFSNLTPCALYELELNAPERSFGFSYLT